MKRVACILLAFAFVFLMSASVSALDYGCDVETVSTTIYFENLDTGTVVLEKNAEQKMYPASTTKIMTYVVVADHVSDFAGTMVPIDADVFSGLDPESTMMGLAQHDGEQYSVLDLLYGMMLPSGNDAALVLADYVGNGIDGFVDMMNAKATELGCTNTHFANPHGLFDENHYSTAKDMATIAKYACTLPNFLEITSTVTYTPASFSQPIHNTNYMLDNQEFGGKYYRSYVRGIKTGYLDEAGKCLVTTAEKDDYHYICVALGAEYSYEEDINYAMLDQANLYDWAFEHIQKQVVYGPTDVIKTVSVKGGKSDKKLNLVPDGALAALLPVNYAQSKIEVEVDCDDTVEAPIEEGQELGTATVRYDGTVVGTTKVIASKSVEASAAKGLAENFGKWLSSNVIIIILIIVIIVALIVGFIAITVAQKKKAAAARAARARRRYRD